METSSCNCENLEYYRNNELSAIDTGRSDEEAVTLQPQGGVEGKPMQNDPGNQEREQQLEAWMGEVKAFIRNIDINKL
jgi:hypothetical protein